MSDLGTRTFGQKEELIFLGKELHEERNYSEETARNIDREVSRLVEEGLKRATDILVGRRDTLERVVGGLLERETLEKESFDALMAGKKLPRVIDRKPDISEKESDIPPKRASDGEETAARTE